jgi:16S rRNA (guanine527-N7)-methyltransferase
MSICVKNNMADLLLTGLELFDLRLPEHTLRRQQQFLDELLRWNRQVNLTSIRNRDEALEKHLLDSLLLLKCLPHSGRLLDMGSGGGLPGIPLAIARPELNVVTIDSVGKKIRFQKHIRRLLALDNLQPMHARLEDLVAKGERFEDITARALSSFGDLISWAAPLQRVGDRLLAMKGPEGADELTAYLSGSDEKYYELAGLHKYQLPVSGSERQLVILNRSSD